MLIAAITFVLLAFVLGWLTCRVVNNTDGTAAYPLLAAIAVGFLMIVDIGFIHYLGGIRC